MKVKVLANFRDKYTNELCEAGKVIDISEKRFNEISASGKFIELVKEKPVRKEEENLEEKTEE